MKFNYKLKRLCGAYYGHPTTTDSHIASASNGSNLVFDGSGNQLISAVSNRIQVLDLQTHTVRTLPVEARSNIRCLALSPDQSLLVVVDVKNYAMLINFKRGVVLHRFAFKKTTRQIVFSPCGNYIAAAHGKQVQMWYTPRKREFAPMVLHRVYTGQADDLTHLCWSNDSSVIAAASRDCTVRIWTVHTTKDYQPVTLSGHKMPLVGVFFSMPSASSRIEACYSISQDGSLVTWKPTYPSQQGEEEDTGAIMDQATSFFTGGSMRPVNLEEDGDHKTTAQHLVNASWSVASRHYFQQDTNVTATSYCSRDQLLVVGFASGLFGLYEMPSVANIHTLSVGSGQLIKSCVINNTGEWLAFGCPASQQLLVWEWRSETYVLKQRGHAYGMRCMAYSPDGIIVCTGGEDGKLKLWNTTSGFCYVTLSPHTAPVTSVVFANSSVVVSASLDGTVRAHDLHRYRTFKTLTTPTPVQFLSLEVDTSGELVMAGAADPFHVYVWNLQTGKLLDMLSGHTGPVCNLSFQNSILASASWDGTVKLWDIYKGNTPVESLTHTSDVVCVTFRPDGKELCSATIGGLLSFWDVENAKLKFEIDGRRDITGGRKINDRMTADNNASSRHFTSVCYSADGSCVLAGGNSKYVCIYEVSQQMLLKKFQVTFNRSLDGVLDELNSKNLVDGGPIDDHAESDDEANYGALRIPGARRGDDGSRKSRVEVLTSQVSFSSTGREWAAVSGEGLHVYSLDEDMIFDPISLTEAITPSAVLAKISAGEHGTALCMALTLNEFSLVEHVLETTPYDSIPHSVRNLGPEQLDKLVQCISRVMEGSPHIEFYLQWCLQLLQIHGMHLEKHRGSFMQGFRSMHKVVKTHYDDLKSVCDENRFTLDFVEDQAKLLLQDR